MPSIGTKAMTFFRRLSLPVLASLNGLGDRPHVKDLIGTVKVMLDAYRAGKLDRLYLCERAVREHHDPEAHRRAALLPIEPLDTEGLQEHFRIGIYEPGCRGGPRRPAHAPTIESQVYRGAVESVASEMAARMVAMKAATDNAGKLISELQLIYNKARQAAITKELSEIVGGAAAV